MPENWWESDPVVSAPSTGPVSGPVYGAPPKPPAPRDALQIAKDKADLEKAERERREWEATHNPDGTPKPKVGTESGTEAERTAGFLTKRIVDGVGRLTAAGQKDREALAPTIGVETVRSVAGDTAANYVTDADRQIVRAAQLDVLDAALTLGTGAAYTREQIEGYRESYFPKLGDAPETIASKQQALRSLLESARIKAGRAAPDIEAAIASLDALSQPVQKDTEPGDEGGPPADYYVKSGGMYDREGNYLGLTNLPDGPVDPDSGEPVQTDAMKLADDPRDQESPLTTLGKQGMTLGLSDEAAGVGGAIGGLFNGKGIKRNYETFRDAERYNIARARKEAGPFGTAVELAAGGALGRVNSAPMSVRQAFGSGAGAGVLGGYGYGEGLEGSVVNAGVGGVLGGGIGGGLQAGGNLATRYLGNRAATNAPLGTKAAELQAAGQAEGVTVNRAMVDSRLQNRVTGVDSTLAGGKVVQPGMEAIEGQIEGRVQNLGRGGTPLSAIEEGDTIKDAATRIIDKTGKSANAKYNRAERLAGDAKVKPVQSLQAADDMIAKLSETPGTNKAEIAFLQEIKGDLSKDLSVGALRAMRTKLRKQISKGDLVFGEDEARVLSIMDAAADDIRVGLTAQGKVKAADAFDAADKSYRARMEYINGTIQKVIGKRNANMSSEQIAARFEAMAKGKDAVGLRRFYAALSPDERADVSATFAEQIGKNTKGEFSVAHFLSQTEPKKMSDEAIRTIFGPEGARSINNLRILGKEVNRVTGAMNSRTSKTGVANDWRAWLANLVLGAGSGFATSSGTTGIAVAAAGAGAKMGRDVLSARALMSPNITKWLRMAPRTANPKAINAHFDQLGKIATMEPALAGEIKTLQDVILRVANDNAAITQSVARDEDTRQVP